MCVLQRPILPWYKSIQEIITLLCCLKRQVLLNFQSSLHSVEKKMKLKFMALQEQNSVLI